MAALTRLEPATLFASSMAISSLGAPATSTSSSLVAPSPSAAMSFASSLHTSVSAAAKRSSSGPDRPPARCRRGIGEREHHVVRAHVVVDGERVEAAFHRAAQRAGERGRPDRGVGGDHRDHRRQRGRDHPEPLQIAEMVTSFRRSGPSGPPS